MSIVVTMADVRATKMCSRGARAWFIQHALDWPDFLKNGISEEKLIATGDSLALKVVEVARGRRR